MDRTSGNFAEYNSSQELISSIVDSNSGGFCIFDVRRFSWV